MKNKNGFIATGLIYSFFLLFLTLFLSSITSHIKNKISLNYIEDDIKESLNSSKYVRDFEPGDKVGFVSDCTSINDDKIYVVANIITNNITQCDGKKDCLILYSEKLYDTDVGINTLNIEHIKSDISSGYLNETYIDKILYKFESSNSNSYSLGIDIDGISYYASIDNVTCYEEDNIYCTALGKIVNDANSYYRERKVQKFTNNKLTTCKVDSSKGVIYVEE